MDVTGTINAGMAKVARCMRNGVDNCKTDVVVFVVLACRMFSACRRKQKIAKERFSPRILELTEALYQE